MTESEYLLLSNLLYVDEFYRERSENKSIGEIIYDGITIRNNIAEMTTAEWKQIIELAKSSDIADLTLVSTHMNDLGGTMSCFLTPDGQAIAVFRGTAAYEWKDNALGANRVMTYAQKDALDWINSLGYSNIITTGHSKGGNKAMFTAIASDAVSGCYSFDGQGFSPEFHKKYKVEIAAMKDNIHSISSYRDFVNILLYPVAGDVRYIYNENGIGGLAEYHSPNSKLRYEYQYNAIFDKWSWVPVLDLAPIAEQSAFTSTLGDMIRYILENYRTLYGPYLVPFVTKGGFIRIMGEALDMVFNPDSGDMNLIEYVTGVVAIPQVYDLITGFLAKLQKEDPEAYEEFLTELHEVLIGLFGIKAANEYITWFENPKWAATSAIGTAFNSDRVTGSKRDFSSSAKQQLLDAVKEAEEELYWKSQNWEIGCFYSKSSIGVAVEEKLWVLDDYQRKIIKLNNSSADGIEGIFEKVYQIEDTYNSKMQRHSSELLSMISVVTSAVSRLVPAM